MVGLRWSLRLLGAVNIAILARLLTPSDFGVVAMATAVVGLSKVFFEFGVDYALIRKNDATEDHFHAAWSIRLLQSFALATVLVVASPYAAAHFDDPRVTSLLWVLAGGVIVQGLSNIGVISFRKELEFDKEFRFLVLSKFLSIGLTITIAFILRSYWALVIGIVAANTIECLLSYRFHPFRPRFSMAAAGDIWSFSKWMMVLHFSNYLTSRFDRMLLGGLVPAGRLGHYTMGIELSQMAATELVAPVSRAIVPGLAKLQVDPKRLRTAFLKTLGATAIVTIPASVGFAVVADEVIPIALGEQWVDAIAVAQVASIHLMFVTLGSAASNISLITGHISKLVALSAIRATLFLSAFLTVFEWGEILGVLYLKLCLAFLMSSAVLTVVSKSHDIPLRKIVAQIWRPAVAATAMAAVILGTFGPADEASGLTLAAKVGVGGAVYVVANALLWRVFGGSGGIEDEVSRLFAKKFRSRTKSKSGGDGADE